MSDFFSTIYEKLIYNTNFWLIFQELYDGGGYVLLGFTFLLIPLFLFAIFYFLWKYPYSKFWHWFLWLLVVAFITSAISWGISNNEIFLSDNQELINALADPESGFEEYANTLPIKYALINGFLAIGLGFIYSLILKQFSKIQIHLPF